MKLLEDIVSSGHNRSLCRSRHPEKLLRPRTILQCPLWWWFHGNVLLQEKPKIFVQARSVSRAFNYSLEQDMNATRSMKESEEAYLGSKFIRHFNPPLHQQCTCTLTLMVRIDAHKVKC